MSNTIYQLKYHSISVDKYKYVTYVVSKYLGTDTIKEKFIWHKTKLPHDMVFTKEYSSTNDEKVEIISIYYNIHYIYCVGSLIFLLSKIVYLCFAVQTLAKMSSNPGTVYFDGLVHLFRWIRYKKNLGLKYYSKIEDVPISELLVQADINTDKKLKVLWYFRLKYCPYNGRITGSYIF